MALTVLQLDSESISELGTSICRLPLQSGVHGGLSPTSKNPGSGLFQTKPVKDPRLKEKNFPRSPEVSHQATADKFFSTSSCSLIDVATENMRCLKASKELGLSVMAPKFWHLPKFWLFREIYKAMSRTREMKHHLLRTIRRQLLWKDLRPAGIRSPTRPRLSTGRRRPWSR